MKKFLLLLAVLPALCLSVSAQEPKYEGTAISVPSVINVNTISNGIATVVDVSNQREVAFSFNTGVGTNIQVRMSASVDGTSWHTNYLLISFNTASVAQNPTITNINIGGIKALRLDSVRNGHETITMTNVFKYGQAISTGK